jgi:hypothetical protein
MSDIWRDVKGHEGRYQVSSSGQVRSLDRVTKTAKGSRYYKGRVLSLAPHSHGYLVVNLRSGSKGGIVTYVHRLVADAFLTAEENKTQVNHKDLNKTNNKVENLEFVTNFENSLHAFASGVLVGKTILNNVQRKEIRKLRKQGLKLKEIAAQFNISESAVSEVARGTTWVWENT